MGKVNHPSNIIDRLRRVEQRVAEVWKKVGVSSAIIRAGGISLLENSFLKMVTADGVRVAYLGPDTEGKQVMYLVRDNGNPMFETQESASGLDFWSWWDNAGRIIVSDDAESGHGLARPWLPVVLYPLFVPGTGDDTAGEVYGYSTLDVTELSGDTLIWEGRASISHPLITIDGLWGQGSGSNNTTYRLVVDGTEVGSWSEGGGLVGALRGPYDVTPWVGSDFAPVQLFASSTGSGAVAVQVFGCYLRQS